MSLLSRQEGKEPGCNDVYERPGQCQARPGPALLFIDTSRFSSWDVSGPGFRRALARVAITHGTLILTGIAVDSGAAKRNRPAIAISGTPDQIVAALKQTIDETGARRLLVETFSREEARLFAREVIPALKARDAQAV